MPARLERKGSEEIERTTATERAGGRLQRRGRAGVGWSGEKVKWKREKRKRKERKDKAFGFYQ